MIKLLVSLAGTDFDGKPFSKKNGDTVNLDAKSEANYIREGMAEPAAKQKTIKLKK
jgi:hypothetical protein